MTNELAVVNAPLPTTQLSVEDITNHAVTVQKVMKAVMIEGTHYGVIPGTPHPTLYKAGAEKLCLTFRISDEYDVQEIREENETRFRVTCIGKHQISGIVLGTGVGECSTGEEKYQWRKAICDPEYDDTSADNRRVKYRRGKGGGHFTEKQIKTNRADVLNTCLKMAAKRAKIAMTLNVTAASDCFSQDLEDLEESLRDSLTEAARKEEEKFPNLTGARKIVLQKTAEEIRALVAKGDDWGAFGLYEPITLNEEKEYLWPMLPSDSRSALKRCNQAKSQMATEGKDLNKSGFTEEAEDNQAKGAV